METENITTDQTLKRSLSCFHLHLQQLSTSSCSGPLCCSLCSPLNSSKTNYTLLLRRRFSYPSSSSSSYFFSSFSSSPLFSSSSTPSSSPSSSCCPLSLLPCPILPSTASSFSSSFCSSSFSSVHCPLSFLIVLLTFFPSLCYLLSLLAAVSSVSILLVGILELHKRGDISLRMALL